MVLLSFASGAFVEPNEEVAVETQADVWMFAPGASTELQLQQ
jgi:hypothetical protein